MTDRARDPRALTFALKRLAIVSSVVLNVGFLSAVLARSSLQGESPAVASAMATVERTLVEVPDDYADYGRYYAALQSRGLSDEEAKTLVLVHTEARAREEATAPPAAYWQRDVGAALESTLHLAEELDEARAALVEAFGAGAESEPAFARLFRPLDPRFSFLSSAQQVAVQKLKLEQQAKRLASSATHAAVAEPVSGVPTDAATVELAAGLAALLEPPVLHEYLLRDSALADQLRRSRVEFTEAEFRETFDVLRRLEESSPDAGVYASARDALRTLLGARRFAALWAGRDPLFAAIARAGVKHALEEETVLSVYELFNDHQDSVLEATRSANGDRQRQGEALQEAQARLESRLSGLVGADVAADIQRSYAQQALTLSRQLTRQ